MTAPDHKARSYEVISAIRYQGRRWAEGATVEMGEALAKDLVARGRLRPKAAKGQAPAGEKGPSKPAATKAAGTKSDATPASPKASASGGKGAALKTAAPADKG